VVANLEWCFHNHGEIIVIEKSVYEIYNTPKLIIQPFIGVRSFFWLLGGFVDYQENDRIKLTDITDAIILIVLREIAVGLYAQKFGSEFVLSLATLLLVLGIMRVLAVKYSPAENKESYISVPKEKQPSKIVPGAVSNRYSFTHKKIDFLLQVIQRFLPVPNTASSDSRFHIIQRDNPKKSLYFRDYLADNYLQIRDQSLGLSAKPASTARYVET
jgi:hypothetical protein